MKDWTSVRGIARLLGVSRESADRIARSGRVRRRRLPGMSRWHYAVDDLVKLADGEAVGQAEGAAPSPGAS
jgi:hypothetical protein